MSLSQAVPEAAPRTTAVKAPMTPRPFIWSVRRELWEHRAIFIAPAAVAALVVFGVLLAAIQVLGHIGNVEVTGVRDAEAVTAIPYVMGSFAVLITGFIVGAFYCLGALHNERRDRSILFWKSMPVSDLTTVGGKAFAALFVLPVALFVIIVVLQLIMMAINAVLLLPSGLGVASLWARWPLFDMTAVLAWTLITAAFWYAPIAAWLLLVGAWAKRAPFLWAVLPPLGLCMVEGLGFHSGYCWRLLGDRLSGGFDRAFSQVTMNEAMPGLAQIDPARFFSSPDVWIGLAAAAGLLFAAVRVRRSREIG